MSNFTFILILVESNFENIESYFAFLYQFILIQTILNFKINLFHLIWKLKFGI